MYLLDPARGKARRRRLLDRAQSACRQSGKLADQIDTVAAARETLKASPDDTHANFVVGHYELCAAGDRQHARVKLAKGDDATWQKLANEDSAPPGNPQQQLALADAWWSQAEKEIWPGQHYLRMRAGELYRRAVASLSGRERTHALNRLKELLAVDDGLPDWGLFDLGRAEKRGTYVRLDPGGTLRTCIEYDAPMDITFVARTDSLNIRLFAHNYPSVIWNWEVNPSELRVANPDGETIPALATSLEANRWYTLRYRVTSQGTTVSVDGLSVFSENKTYAKFPRSPVGVNGEGPAVIDVKKFVVRPIE